MTRTTDRRSSLRAGRRARRRTPGGRATVGALLALAVVTTAGAPALITIRPGDTLWDLARTHGTSVSTLQQLNGLDGGTIYVGRTLRLPGGTGGTSPSTGRGSAGGEVSHTVRSGETLSGLAARYGTTTRAIQTRNGLTSSTIRIGRALAMPAGSGSAPAAAAPATRTPTPAVAAGVQENRRILASRSHPSRDEVRRMIGQTARQYGVSPSLAVAVAYQESGFQQRVVSPVNAIGVMQVLPRVGRTLAQQYGVSINLLDTQDNITAGVLLLRQLQRQVGNEDRMLAGYYQGAGSIARQGILPVTEQYIRNIRILKQRFPNG